MQWYHENMRDVFGDTLVELGERDERIVVLDADLCTSTTAHKFRDRFPKRFYECGIAEANLFSVAAGLAAEGFIPFPSTFAAFAARRALDNIYMHICCNNANVKIPGSYPGLTATECGPSHNACEDIGIFASLPNVRVVDAGDNRELRSAMLTIAEDEGPVYFRVSKAVVPVLFDESYRFAWGKGYVLRQGSDLALVSTGMMTGIALRAAQLLEHDAGIHTRVLHMPSIQPIDEELLVKAAQECGVLITLENGRAYGGFGAVVSEVICRSAPAYVFQMGVGRNDLPGSDNLYHLLQHHGMTPEAVQTQAMRLLKKKGL